MGPTRDEKIKLNMTELHATNKKVKDLAKDNRDLKTYVYAIRKLLVTLGIPIILFGFFLNRLANANTWQYQPGFGWAQWSIIIIGFLLTLAGVWKKP